MSNETDPAFFKRADAMISLANDQLEDADIGAVSASFLYAAARFNAFVSAANCETAQEMAASKSEMVDYFLDQYRTMITEHLEDYAANFDAYTGARG
ncbi:MAG: DUF3144 domain-containing protein [Rhodobacter sp.]|jgi:hypothetical protein|nr:DUF3144 domain-containing protein [Rhodobacter sp.]